MVTGPCFDDYKQVFCHFEASLGGISPEAIVLDGYRVLCVVPQLGSMGRSTFKLLLVNQTDQIIESKKRHFFSRKWALLALMLNNFKNLHGWIEFTIATLN